MIAAAIAGFLSGMIGAMGLGGGSVLILYLTLWAGLEQSQAQGINLAFFLPCAAVAVALHARKKQIDWTQWLRMAPLGVVGAIGGALLIRVLGGDALRRVFAAFLLIYGTAELLHVSPKHPRAFSRRKPHTYEVESAERGNAPSDSKHEKKRPFFVRRR